jgi:menaquinone-9 beta-reductase
MVIPAETDVFVVGSGPAGIAAALAARRLGFEVCMADRGQAPIDKACGEGLMPDGVAALRRLGVVLGPGQGMPFRGIRFADDEHVAEASFPGESGIGIRRTLLHEILLERAEAAGIVSCWRTQVTGLEPEGVRVGDRIVRCRWIIGADGSPSRIRQWAGLHPVWDGGRRIGLRQHFRVKPWSDFVEVYWARGCQAYVTPIGSEEICIALLGQVQGMRMSDWVVQFPQLGRRLANAEPIGAIRGGFSASTRFHRVTQGRMALIGDASGSVDAVTGEGLTLAFRQAAALGAALEEGDLASYEAMHRRIGRMPLLMARLLLLMDEHDGLRKIAVRSLAARPHTFGRLLSVHVGARHPAGVSLDVLTLALRLAAGSAAAQFADAAR